MVELRGEWDRSMIFRARRMLGPVSVFAQVGMSVALLVVMAQLVWPVAVGVRTALPRAASLPIGQLTPGAIANVGVDALCSGSAPTRAMVPLAVRQQVLQRYRMETVPTSEYELDYLITPELGGVSDARNLWPERYDTSPWNAHVKDDLERVLARGVCDGSIDLAAAQREIATNWIDAYKKRLGTDRPIPRQAGIEDDDDDIQFEPARAVPGNGPTLILLVPVRVLVSARLAFDAAGPLGAARHAAWP
jgi:hypothetical protein